MAHVPRVAGMMSDLEAIDRVLAKAHCPEDVFGELSGDTPKERSHALTLAWRKLTQVTHPDKYTGNPAAGAQGERIFILLNEWKRRADAKVAAGSYGDSKPHVEPAKPVEHHPVSVTVGKRVYTVGIPLFTGDLATIYACSWADDPNDRRQAVFKLARSAADNDLMEAEQKALATIWPKGSDSTGDRRLITEPYDSFMLKGTKGARRVNVLKRHDAYYSLAEVLATYADGIDFRDMVWMFKRALAALGFVHKLGVIHGAILPPHILIHPMHHGAKLVDWCYSVIGKGRVRAMVSSHKPYYAPEVLAKQPASEATDIYMLAKCAVALLGGEVASNRMPDKVPRQVQAFLQGCLLANPSKRPNDAWGLHEELNDLLERLVGPPKYRPFFMPARA